MYRFSMVILFLNVLASMRTEGITLGLGNMLHMFHFPRELARQA